MNNTQKCFELTTLAAALLVAFGSAVAADEDTAAPLDQPVSSVSAGIGYWNNDRPQFGIFDGMRDDGAYLLLDANINKRDDATGTWKTLEVQDLGTNAREIRGEYLRQGDFGVTLDYNQTPRVAPYTVNTGLLGIGTETQTVTNITPGEGANVQLETERKKLGVGFYKNLQAFMPGVDIKVNFSNEKKEGNRNWSRGGAPEFAAEPIDFTTNQLDASLNYVGKALQLSGGYVGSWFKNGNDLVCSRTASQSCWDSTAPYYLSLPLDNQAHQAFLSGAYRFTPTTMGTFKASYTRATQDEHIPTSDISGLTWLGDSIYPAAPTHLDGEINTTLLQLGLTSRPLPKLNLVANIRYHDVDDQTPVHLIVNSVSATTSGSRYNGFERSLVNSTPLSFETLTGKLEGIYSLSDGYTMIVGMDYSTQDRSVPYGSDVAGGTITPVVGDDQPDGHDDQRYVPWRSKIEEITYRLQLRKSLSETLTGSLAYLYSERDGSAYTEAIHSEPGEGIHPESIDPINIADRDRNKLRLMVDWAPTEKLGLQFVLEDSKDEYSGHTYGLRDGEARLFTVDASYVLNDAWQASAWASHDTAEAYQRGWREGSTTAAELDKKSYFKDAGNSIGLGLKGGLNPKLKVGADLQWTRTKSEIYQELTNTTGTTGTVIYAADTDPNQLPDITNTVTTIKLFAEYALKKNADIRIDLIHERWKTDDWSWLFSDGSAFAYDNAAGNLLSDGTSIITDPKQNATFVGARYSYRF